MGIHSCLLVYQRSVYYHNYFLKESVGVAMTTTDIKKRWYIWIISAVMLAVILYLFSAPLSWRIS